MIRVFTSSNLCFLFPGQGTAWGKATRSLYEAWPLYAEQLDACLEKSDNWLDLDLRKVLFAQADSFRDLDSIYQQTAFVQPALFVIEYALSQALMKIGVGASGFVGHSVGEYAAACLAGVFSFDTGLEMVAKRGQLIQKMPPGAMLAAAVSVDETEQFLSDKISLASINGRRQCVFSGCPDGIDLLARQLKTHGIAAKRLPVTRAFHSAMLDPVLDPFREFVASKDLQQPLRPFISCLHGRWADPDEVRQADYWVRQMREPVQFLRVIQELTARPNVSFLEIGPAGSMSQLVSAHFDKSEASRFLTTSPPSYSETSEVNHLLGALKQLQKQGLSVNLERVSSFVLCKDSQKSSIEHDKKEVQTGDPNDDQVGIDALEEQVADLFCRILGIDEIDKDESFLTAGGNSLMAMQVISRIRASHAISIPISKFFKAPTVSGVTCLAYNLLQKKTGLESPRGTTPSSDDRRSSHNVTVVEPLSSAESAMEKGRRGQQQAMRFSLSFFAGDENANSEDRYGSLMEAARFVDQAGFSSIWLPERHFNKFGGLYPSPTVLGASIAAITKQIHIRGGSVVAPLHHPIRIAEEWSVVDNLSKGRVGVAFGSGFHPNDFVFAPDAFGNRKERMFETIASVQKLWQGGTYQGCSGAGDRVEVKIFPRPYSSQLPIWLTTSRSAETFTEAGQLNAGILTSLLRLSVAELKERIGLYRKSLEENGYDPRAGHVTLMLHTFLATSPNDARSQVEVPLRAYLRSHMEHTKAVSFGKVIDENDARLSPEEEEMLLDYALDRYLETSSLIGTEESCFDTVTQLKRIGVDEIACLVDFGVEHASLMSSLQHLQRLRSRIEPSNE